uniref:Uncharacterized protein n=1 Tax=Plectus sambesii TaxID=2011161 RepID=A0A914V372_9BILA
MQVPSGPRGDAPGGRKCLAHDNYTGTTTSATGPIIARREICEQFSTGESQKIAKSDQRRAVGPPTARRMSSDGFLSSARTRTDRTERENSSDRKLDGKRIGSRVSRA